ncbi:MAG: hypothetical protein EOO25_10570, partial [Comamonadaceae bacterium]
MLKLYGFSKVNAVARGHTRDLRVLWALEELQLPFEIAGMDHPAKDLNTEAYRALNPFEQIPVIDDDGVVVSESAAILLYLARKAGRLIPSDLAGESQVLRWSFAAMNTLEIPLFSLVMIDWVKDDPCVQYRANTTYPQARADLERSIMTVAALPCDILVSAHPEASDLWERKAKADQAGHRGFIDRSACRTYA